MTSTETPAPRARRLGLFIPVILLLLLAAGWSAFWFYARGQAETRLTAALQREASLGRQWTCRDRAFGGYPFRLELRCADLELIRTTGGAPIRLSLGGFAALTQVYAPGHVIAESPGPLTITAPGGAVTQLDWATGQMSLRLSLSGLERASLQFERPRLKVSGAGAADGEGAARLLELHLRRHPVRPAEERAQEASLTLTDATGPWLEAIIRNGQPGQLAAALTLPQAPLFLAGIRPETLKSWAATGSVLTIDRLQIRKGPSELQLSGTLGIDEANRPKGRIAARQTGITEIAGLRVGGLLGLGGLLAPPQAPQAGDALKPLPNLDLRDGRVYLGPVRIPEIRLDPLF